MSGENQHPFKMAYESLIHADYDGFLDAIESSEFDINSIDHHGKSLLHYASEFGLTPFVAMLVDRGANVNLQDNLGNTPLHYAINNFLCFEEFFIRKYFSGPDNMMFQKMHVDEQGPKHAYSYSGSINEKYGKKDNFLIPFLIANGADLAIVNSDGKVPETLFPKLGELLMGLKPEEFMTYAISRAPTCKDMPHFLPSEYSEGMSIMDLFKRSTDLSDLPLHYAALQCFEEVGNHRRIYLGAFTKAAQKIWPELYGMYVTSLEEGDFEAPAACGGAGMTESASTGLTTGSTGSLMSSLDTEEMAFINEKCSAFLERHASVTLEEVMAWAISAKEGEKLIQTILPGVTIPSNCGIRSVAELKAIISYSKQRLAATAPTGVATGTIFYNAVALSKEDIYVATGRSPSE